jgi:FkbH-like protein
MSAATTLKLSRFVHLAPVGENRVLVIHAVTHLRLAVDGDLAKMISLFAEPQDVSEEVFGPGAFAPLIERGILTSLTPQEEMAALSAELSAVHGRDPAILLERLRRQAREGGEPYWAAHEALKIDDVKTALPRMDVVLFGDCDIQMEADFLRREALDRGVDLRVAATFPDDLRFAAEHAHDAIVVGGLRARHLIAQDLTAPDPTPEAAAPFTPWLSQARQTITTLRTLSSAPILIDNLPEPTVQPMGFADRGINGHRTRFRMANVALADLAEGYADVQVVDVGAAYAAAGAEKMLDDGQVGFTHFGSPGWMLQRPESEKAAVHALFPDPAPLIRALDGDLYGRERVMAKVHIDALFAATGRQQKKCVILDLDGTLWPGVLAETGAPFAWSPEISGPFSYIGLYFGLHEALKWLKRRGVLLACVSKNDEATVRELWRYPVHYPLDRLLTPDDFVTWRVNWSDKAENIVSIAEELGFALDAFVFVDDHPVERARVIQRLPEVEVWGEDPFELRRRLLSDPRLQPPQVTAESARRTDLTKAQLERARARTGAADEAAFIKALAVEVQVTRLAASAPELAKPELAKPELARLEELFRRTTQFNTTGAKYSVADLERLLARPETRLFTVHVRDRFGDHGLVGAAVIVAGEILGLALSCRVLGLGVEQRFIAAVIEALRADHGQVFGAIIDTARNGPVRNLYADNGFERDETGLWRRGL